MKYPTLYSYTLEICFENSANLGDRPIDLLYNSTISIACIANSLNIFLNFDFGGIQRNPTFS